MKKEALWVFVVVWGIACLCGSHGCREQERVALLALNATLNLTYGVDAGGSSFNCCSWQGVECNPTTGRVTQLMLSSSRYDRFGSKIWYLNASLLIPFQELKSLNLSSNYLGGWIAPEEPNLLSSRLSKLEVLDLSDNFLDHSILSILSTIPSLRHLSLIYNNLSGTLHVNGGFSNLMELDISDNAVDVMAIAEGGFSNLKELDISDNPVDVAAITEGIKNLSHLENLYLDGVHLKDVGTVVRALGALSSLKILSLQYNTIEGTITTQDFHNFSKLEHLILDYSSLNTTMGILSSLGPLTSLRLLSSYSTSLNGKLSGQSLCNLVKLEELDLSNNGITGGLPACWRNMTSIRVLFLEDNEFTDNVASSPLTSLTSLELLSISGNYFDIPSSLSPLANYSRLKVLLLDDNKLTTDSKVASSILRFQLKDFSMSNSLSKGFKVTSLGFLNHQYDLRTIDLSSNDIAGPFPAWLLENNTKLENLLMANNLFATLEVPLMTLRNLSVMDMSNNGMRGELTTEFCLNVPNLSHLNLSANRLEGNIPSELGNIKSLNSLDLSHNNFSGRLPIQLLDSNSSLYKLNVAYNNLQGEIVFSDDTKNLNWLCLHLENNMFTGDLSFLSSLINPFQLDVSNNFFIGKLPRVIANMSRLRVLNLSKNKLNGLIPQGLFNLPDLEYLALSDNNLSGSLASSFIAPKLRHIHLNGNKLNGSIVHLLPNNSKLVTLDLSENEFLGSIPYWLGNLSQLSILLLRGNSFYGTFPKQLCRLKSLSMIDLSENNLFGPLPICLGPINFSSIGYPDKVDLIPCFGERRHKLSPLSYVRTIRIHWSFNKEFYHYKFMGDKAWQIPHIVGFTAKRRFDAYKGYALLNMVGLDFSCNQFSGEIPPEIAFSQDIVVLNLSHNKLTGHIPMSLSNLTQIESIDLSYNNLIGSIPEELTRLNFLGVFNVSYNDLSGAIPNKNQFGSFDESSYYGNHLLCGLPLSNDCSTTINVNCSATKSHKKAKEDGFIDGETFYISFGVSYTMVLLVIPIVLFINPHWQQGWFHYVELIITTCRSLFITCYYLVQDGFRKLSSGRTI
ncbi:receptor-like protein 15 [Eucalyptus grandis]|uniref:receptor-like protein 15 n=1 Tax=Eucalyptus grandis TaxID=71139 RepID=UPI00192EF34A|nr:receptor-like protein 15 [Eucalyptus grandis]